MTSKEFIVAIELGSSKITGIAGKKNLDGSVSILGVVKEDSSVFIRKGTVYNIDKTALCLSGIIDKLTKMLNARIAKVYVGVGGQSIRSVRNTIRMELPQNTIISQEMVCELMDNNRSMEYPEQEILDVATQEYKVETQYQLDPVGIQATCLEGNFLNILERKSFYRNLNTCFRNAGIQVAEMYLSPMALADSVLTEAEKRSGCALIDLGADTTTVSVYHKNILRHLAVIPLGGNNITKDIASLQMEESEAEMLKLKYASAYTERKGEDEDRQITFDTDRKVAKSTFDDIVEARLEEIIKNVWAQVPTEYCERLLGGIILTGGGSNLANIEKAFSENTNVTKIRIAKTVNITIDSTHSEIRANDAMMNTALGLLIKGDLNCAGGDIADETNFFGNEFDERMPRSASEMAPGVVMTEAEKQKAEEMQRQKEEEKAREQEEAEGIAEKKNNKKPNKLWGMFKKFGEKVFAPEEDDE